MNHNNTQAGRLVNRVRMKIDLMKELGLPKEAILAYITAKLWRLQKYIDNCFTDEGYNRLHEIFLKELEDMS